MIATLPGERFGDTTNNQAQVAALRRVGIQATFRGDNRIEQLIAQLRLGFPIPVTMAPSTFRARGLLELGGRGPQPIGKETLGVCRTDRSIRRVYSWIRGQDQEGASPNPATGPRAFRTGRPSH